MDPITTSIAQGVAKAALDKILDQKDQTLEDGQKDNALVARLNASLAAAGMHPDQGGDGASGSAGKAG